MITFTIIEFTALSLVILNSILIVKAWKDHKHISGLEMWIDALIQDHLLDNEDAD